MLIRTLIAVSLILLVLFVLACFLYLRQQRSQTLVMTNLVNQQSLLNQNLLNRIQAGDLRTYLSLETQISSGELVNTNSVPPMTDLEEFAREQSAIQGLGQFANDDDAELDSVLSEFGITTE